MTLTIKRAALVAALAIFAPGCSAATPPAPAAPRFNLQVVVGGCYTHSDIRVLVDGRPLALTPPGRREDTVAICYNAPMALGTEARVDLRLGAQSRRITVRPSPQSRYLVIDPTYAPYAELSHDPPMYD